MDEQKREVTVAVGNRIKYFRRLRDMSQEELALRANLNPAYFGQVERGLKCPTIDTLCKVAKALEVSPAELLQTGFTGEQASLYARRAAELLAGVPDDKLEQVLRILEDVTDLFRKPLL